MNYVTYSKDRKLKVIVRKCSTGFVIDVCCLNEDNSLSFWREMSTKCLINLSECVLNCIRNLKSHKRFIYDKCIPFPKS